MHRAVLRVFTILSCTAVAAVAHAQTSSADLNDLLKLMTTYRGKVFCAPPTTTIRDAVGVVSAYVSSHPELQGRYSDQQALQALAIAYPCHVDANTPIKDLGGKTIDVTPTGQYATIETGPTIAAIQKLRFGPASEESDIANRVAHDSGAYTPPVLFALAEWYYRQGNIDRAIFWLNAAGLRGRFDGLICTDRTAISAVAELSQKEPQDLYRQQFQDRDRIRKIVEEVIDWDEHTKARYDHRWISLHGLRAIDSGLGKDVSNEPLTVPEERWQRIAEDNRANYRSMMLHVADSQQSSNLETGHPPSNR
jgi:hypothetical protein